MEYEGRLGHDDELQMRHSEMGNTSEYLSLCSFMHGGNGSGETERQRTAIDV